PRTLVIKSIESQGRQRYVDAEYGGAGGYGGGTAKPEPVEIQLGVFGGGIIPPLPGADLSPRELTRHPDRRPRLRSVLAPSPARGGARAPAAIKLEKVE